MVDKNWPEVCTLQGCSTPKARGHHHHWMRGHLNVGACVCKEGGYPGTSKELDEQSKTS